MKKSLDRADCETITAAVIEIYENAIKAREAFILGDDDEIPEFLEDIEIAANELKTTLRIAQ